MVSDVLKDLQANLDKGIDALKKDLGKVRTGRANVGHPRRAACRLLRHAHAAQPSLVGERARPAPITIKPWEKSLIPEIEKVIRSSSLGLNPSSDGEIVRLPMPPLTEERRKDLVKMVKKMAEDCKVALRKPAATPTRC